MSEGVSPKNLNHFQKLRSATITANLAPGYTLGEAVDFMERHVEARAAERRHRPERAVARVPRLGRQRSLRCSCWRCIFIYLVLAAQFESFVDPFIIMLTVPLSMTGAFAALLLSGGTLNIYSQIGVVTLVGLITKHGILIVEFANQLQEQGTRSATRWSRRRCCGCAPS